MKKKRKKLFIIYCTGSIMYISIQYIGQSMVRYKILEFLKIWSTVPYRFSIYIISIFGYQLAYSFIRNLPYFMTFSCLWDSTSITFSLYNFCLGLYTLDLGKKKRSFQSFETVKKHSKKSIQKIRRDNPFYMTPSKIPI